MHESGDSVESFSITVNLFVFINDNKKKKTFVVFLQCKGFKMMQLQCISHIQTM